MKHDLETLLNISSRGGLPYKKDETAPRIFKGLKKDLASVRISSLKGPTAGDFVVPLRVWSKKRVTVKYFFCFRIGLLKDENNSSHAHKTGSFT